MLNSSKVKLLYIVNIKFHPFEIIKCNQSLFFNILHINLMVWYITLGYTCYILLSLVTLCSINMRYLISFMF